MKISLVAMLTVVMLFPNLGIAQKAGSFVGGIEVGITSATGTFRTDTLEASTGFGIGAEVRYYLFNNFSFGPFVRYNRFGSNLQSSSGDISYNFPEYGGTVRLNMFNISSGKLFLAGSGGIFKPKRHTWAPEVTTDESFDSGTLFSGGIGISSNPYAAAIYELEVRYNTGDADLKTIVGNDELKTNYKFNFVYILMKLSFNSKGFQAPPRY